MAKSVFIFIVFLTVIVALDSAQADAYSSEYTLVKLLNKTITVYDEEDSYDGIDIPKRSIPVPQTIQMISESGTRYLINTSKGDKWVDSFEVKVMEKNSNLSEVIRNRSSTLGGRGMAE